MENTSVTEEATGMQYLDPDGRPSPMVEAVTRMLDSAPKLTVTDLEALRTIANKQLELLGQHEPWCTRDVHDERFGTICSSEDVEFEHGEGDAHEGGSASFEGNRHGLQWFLEIFTPEGEGNLTLHTDSEGAKTLHRLLTNVPVEAGAALGRLLDQAYPKAVA